MSRRCLAGADDGAMPAPERKSHVQGPARLTLSDGPHMELSHVVARWRLAFSRRRLLPQARRGEEGATSRSGLRYGFDLKQARVLRPKRQIVCNELGEHGGRSEERRVGKESRSRCARKTEKK